MAPTLMQPVSPEADQSQNQSPHKNFIPPLPPVASMFSVPQDQLKQRQQLLQQSGFITRPASFEPQDSLPEPQASPVAQ
jgi:hypothetical protein